jgi:hypothetical protein
MEPQVGPGGLGGEILQREILPPRTRSSARPGRRRLRAGRRLARANRCDARNRRTRHRGTRP